MSGRTPYATETHDTPQKDVRVPDGQVGYVVIHHAATLDLDAVVQLEMGGKQVSSTVIVKDGRVASMFDETYRAWSLSSQYWDSVSLSSETCNSGGADQGWPISEESYVTLAKIVADWCARYSIPCDRDHVIGHREVYTRYGASYATACPGGIDLDALVARAQQIKTAGTGSVTPFPISQEDDDMKVYEREPNSGVFGLAYSGGWIDIDNSKIANVRDVLTQAFGAPIQQHAADYDAIKALVMLTKPALVLSKDDVAYIVANATLRVQANLASSQNVIINALKK